MDGGTNGLIMHYRHKARKAITGYLDRIINRTGLVVKVLPGKAADSSLHRAESLHFLL